MWYEPLAMAAALRGKMAAGAGPGRRAPPRGGGTAPGRHRDRTGTRAGAPCRPHCPARSPPAGEKGFPRARRCLPALRKAGAAPPAGRAGPGSPLRLAQAPRGDAGSPAPRGRLGAA